MDTIEQIINIEWKMFQALQNIGGRASCQDNYPTFRIMRVSQFEAWDEETRKSYLKDLQTAEANGGNLLAAKYRNMDFTLPKEEKPQVSEENAKVVDEIMEIFMEDTKTLVDKYPHFMSRGRALYSSEDGTGGVSIETYLKGELLTYSLETNEKLLAHTKKVREEGGSVAENIQINTVMKSGFESLEDADNVAANRG